MDNATAVLRDIHGLDVIPWWPLAPGWWIGATLLGLLVLILALRYWLSCSGILPGWRGDARRHLRELKKAMKHEEPREIASRLSILLRRIAMAGGGRQRVASLTGENWLDWLEQNDSTGFRWTRHGRLLLEAPYMPPSRHVAAKDVARLVTAARRWIEARQPADDQCSYLQRRQRLMKRFGARAND